MNASQTQHMSLSRIVVYWITSIFQSRLHGDSDWLCDCKLIDIAPGPGHAH